MDSQYLTQAYKVSSNDSIEETPTQPIRMNSTLISSFPWYTGAIKDYQQFSGKVLADSSAMEVSSFHFFSKHFSDWFF
jgi:hypothetical protein